jgi:hypothetical protein
MFAFRTAATIDAAVTSQTLGTRYNAKRRYVASIHIFIGGNALDSHFSYVTWTVYAVMEQGSVSSPGQFICGICGGQSGTEACFLLVPPCFWQLLSL